MTRGNTTEIKASTLSNIIRFLIKTAQEKRVVMYYELENLFGLSHKAAGDYAGAVGDFCIDKEYPLLNSLIINATTCKPSKGFDKYLADLEYDNWGDCLAGCWRYFHITSSRDIQVRNFTGLNVVVREWVTDMDRE